MKRHKFLETKRTPRYSLRKLNVGMVSVLLGVTIFGINFTDHSVKAATPVESVENPNSSPTGNLPQTSAVVLRTTGQTKGINAIGAVKVPDSQNDANKAIDAALNKKNSEINGATNIDQTTKDKLNQAATDAADKAQDAINKATTNNDVATEQTDTQKAASATGKVQQSSASNNATANNSTEAATTSSTKAKQTTQTATKNSDNTKVSSNTTNKENSQPTDKTTNTQVASNIDKTLASLLTKLLATASTDDSASGSSTLSKSDQTVKKVTDPMMSDYQNRGGKNTWIDQTIDPGYGNYADNAENAIFGDTGIIKTNPHKYFFAGYADFSESYHRIILFARGQDASDKNLYTYVVHTKTDNVQPQTEKPNETAPEIGYRGVWGFGGSTHNLQVHNYNGESFSVVLKGFKGGYGLTPIFDQGILNPKYKDKPLAKLDGPNGINYKEQIGSWASVIPQETTTSVRYVDQETGKDIAQPLIVSGFGYQGFKINGDAPKIDGYTLVSSPKTLGLSYEDGIIAPYKVGQTYKQYFTDDVYVKQTVIDTNGTVRATAYYKGQPLGASASKILGHDDNNDSMSFKAGGQSYTYNNRINKVDAAMVYYYQKVGEEGKSQLRVHYIDVTKDTDDSQYAPGDGVPATDPISGQEMKPLTYTGNIGKTTYDYATNAKIPEGYVLVGTSPNIKGTFSKSDHDAYIYVKIDRNGAKATIENLTYLNHAQKQAAEAAIDQATDLNTMNQATSTATTLDGDMGKLSDLTADLTNTNNYKYASDTPKSTVATDYTNADVLLDKDDKTAGQNADDATVLKLIDQINTHKSSLDGDTNLSAAKTTISGLTHLNDAQRSAANQAVTNASDLTGLKTAVGNAQSVDSAMSDLQTAVNQANEAKTTNNYLQASADKQDNLNSVVQNAQAVLAATGANDSANQVKALTKSVNDAVDALDGESNLAKAKDQADQNIDQLTNLSADQKKAAKDKINSAKTSSDVTNAKNDANTLNDNLGKLNQAISDANSAKSTPNYTEADSGQQTALDDALSAAEKAKNSNDPSAVATATKHLQDAQSGLNGNSNLAKAKDQADQNIDDVAKAAKQAIDNTNGITDSEKQAAKGQADADANAAKEAIANADSTKAVTDAVNNGTVAINKDDANAAIDGALAEKNNSIEDAPNLTTEEKQAVKEQAKTVADSAKTNISNAKTVTDVASAKNTGVENIKNMPIPTSSKTKNDANSALDTTADAAKKAIDETSGLTDDQKQTAKDQIDTAVGDAQENIKKASDNQGVAAATDAGKLAIDKVSAKAAIDAALNNKKSAIAKAPLTAEEAKPLNDLVDQEADAAKAAIDDATTNAVVEAAKNNGVETINNINVPATSATKDDANKAIDDALAKKVEEINNANLTDDQKQSLIDQAQNAANQAKENVRSASTDEDVQTAKNNGIAAINGITVKSNSVDDQDNSATNEGNGNQAGHIQSDNSSDVTNHSSIQQSGNEKTQLPQTGNETQRGAGLVGLAIAGLVGLLGSAGFHKKRD